MVIAFMHIVPLLSAAGLLILLRGLRWWREYLLTLAATAPIRRDPDTRRLTSLDELPARFTNPYNSRLS